MSVFRINKNQNYTVISNFHLRERNMSLKAKGLLTLMLSLPESWDYSIKGLVSICKENETAIRTALNELKEFGYLHINKLLPDKTESGRIEYIYDIFETPKTQKQNSKKQDIENLPLESQPLENPIQLNTKEINTNKLNTKEEYMPKNKKAKKEVGVENKKDTNYQDIVDEFNSICTSLPKVKIITRSRKRAIKARLNDGYNTKDFIRLFKKTQESNFLNGKNDKNWVANFDWLIQDNNMAKVIEGNYDNKANSYSNQKPIDPKYDANKIYGEWNWNTSSDENTPINTYGKDYNEPWE